MMTNSPYLASVTHSDRRVSGGDYTRYKNLCNLYYLEDDILDAISIKEIQS